MTVATDLLAVMSKLSSAERELLDLRLGSKWRNYLASPSALSNTQLMELTCTLRRLAPVPADVLFETMANSIWVLPVAPADGTEVVIPNTTLCAFTVNGLAVPAETEATFIYEATSGSWATLYSTGITPLLPDAHDFGTTVQGPAETSYSVPADTVAYVTIGTDDIGNSVRKIISTTYAQRGPTAAEGGGGFTYTNAIGVGGILVASPAAAWAGFYASIPNLSANSRWNICPVVSGGSGFYVYDYNEPTYDAPDINGNVNIRDAIMKNNYSGGGISCAEIAARITTIAVTYAIAESVIGAAAANAYYLDTHIVWTYDVVSA